MTAPPTLAEMRHALLQSATNDSEKSSDPPTLAEMMHANTMYRDDPEAYLEHYGIKGMKWGVRRSDALLGRLRRKKPSTDVKDEGGVVGGIRAKTRAGAQKLKDMRDGTTIVLEDADGATKVMSKQKDGTFKEVYLSADAERTLRTSKKAESELSDREINEAINRAKKIEEYNKLFNREPNPNADLQAKVEALSLQLDMKRIEAQLNPPKVGRVKRFIKGAEGAFDTYQRLDKKTGGRLQEVMDDIVKEATSGKATQAGLVAKVAAAASQARADNKSKSQAKQDAEDRFWSGGETTKSSPFSTKRGGDSYSDVRLGDATVSSGERKRVNDFVYNITTLGDSDPMNPYYSPPSAPATPLPQRLYPELESRRN